jgi:SAM-dependent methyltransferase
MTHRSVPAADRNGGRNGLGMLDSPPTRREMAIVVPACERDRMLAWSETSTDRGPLPLDRIFQPAAESVAAPEKSWDSYWETLPCRIDLHRLEADDFVSRLATSVALNPTLKVLDFGSGFGLVAAALAPLVGTVWAWDSSPMMRAWTLRNAACPNIHVLNDPDPGACGRLPAYDLIVVNSVLQYVPPVERRAWLPIWRRLLAPNGGIVLSDLVPHDQSMRRDLVDLCRFYVQRGRLTRALVGRCGDAVRYWRARRARPLTRISRDELCSEAAAAGLRATFLDGSLTHRSHRDAALLHPR